MDKFSRHSNLTNYFRSVQMMNHATDDESEPLLASTSGDEVVVHRRFAAPLEIKIDYFQNKMSSFRPELGPLGAYIFSLG